MQSLKMFKPDVVYYEQVRRHAGTQAAHIYGGYKAVLFMVCQNLEIPLFGLDVKKIKKHFTGNGNAEKADMIKACQALGYEPDTHNAADAIAILHMAAALNDANFPQKRLTKLTMLSD